MRGALVVAALVLLGACRSGSRRAETKPALAGDIKLARTSETTSAGAGEAKSAVAATPADSPFATMVPVNAELERALQAVIDGEDPKQAFKPYRFEPFQDGELPYLRGQGIARVQYLHNRLVLFRKLKSMETNGFTVHAGPAGAVLLGVVGDEPNGDPLTAFTGRAKAHGDAARAVLDWVRAGRCKDMPLGDAARFPDWSAEDHLALKDALVRAPRQLSLACGRMEVDAGEWKLSVRETVFLARDRASQPIGHVILDLYPDHDDLVVRLLATSVSRTR